MTEEEAKTKWCPFARVMVSAGSFPGTAAVASANRFDGNSMALCIGSACMAWHPFAGEGSCGLVRE